MKKILIIEDDRNIAELERDYLKLNGFEADIESNGEKATRMALSNSYALLIVDLMLPGKSGFDIICDVRRKLETPRLSFLRGQTILIKYAGSISALTTI